VRELSKIDLKKLCLAHSCLYNHIGKIKLCYGTKLCQNKASKHVRNGMWGGGTFFIQVADCD
jgi:hypothetical protein